MTDTLIPITRPKIEAFIPCSNNDCATEISYPLWMVRWRRDEVICENCYWEERTADDPDWSDLPPVTLADLRAD